MSDIGSRLMSLLGVFIILGLAWLLCDNKKRLNFRTVLWGTLIQFIFAVIILRTAPGELVFSWANKVIVALLNFTNEGTRFVFGWLYTQAADNPAKYFSFAIQVLPTIIFFASFMGVLYYLGIMQAVVKAFAWVMMRLMGTSGAETLCTTANIFVGQTEAPLLVKPFVEKSTRSELMAIMTGGMATIAGGVMGAYTALLAPYFPNIAGHLLAASVMSAPAALVMTKLMIPETEEPQTMGTVKIDVPKTDANIIDAACNGAGLGLHLALNVGAMLLAFIALIALVNSVLQGGTAWLGQVLFHVQGGLTLEMLFSWIFAPFAFIMGVRWEDCLYVGKLIGLKTVLNEFVGYFALAEDLKSGLLHVDPRSILIAVYALCGFSNFSSIAIQIGGIGGIAPSRRSDIARLGIAAVVAGSLACFMTAAIAGVVAPSVQLIPPTP